MKADSSLKTEEIESKIKILLSDVGLSSLYNVTIGTNSSKKVLSGGEKKRLAFASEVTNI